MLHKHRKLTSGLSLFCRENARKPWNTYKNVSCANATCLGALITGHSKFLLVTGECCKKRWHTLCCNAKFWKTRLFSWVLGCVFFECFCGCLQFLPQSFSNHFFRNWISGIKLQDHCLCGWRTLLFSKLFNAWAFAPSVCGSAWSRLSHLLGKQSKCGQTFHVLWPVYIVSFSCALETSKPQSTMVNFGSGFSLLH